jgi:antitoxin component YwqK of YwqJK toxin-antitoxin module
LQGDSKIYYEDGSINKIEKYKNNKLDGDTKIYSNNNSEIPMYIDTYVNGKKVMRRAFSGKGDQIFKIRY